MKKITPGMLYNGRQNPAVWLFSAERLREAAEVILLSESRVELKYADALEKACAEAHSLARASKDGNGRAEIQCDPPNYLPAQLLYGFAIENALKGLMIAHNPALASDTRLNKKIKTHKLIDLAAEAAVSLYGNEKDVLKSLSHIVEWAGRYPAAAHIDWYYNERRSLFDENTKLLDPTSAHPIIRDVFKRSVEQLKEKLPRKPERFGVVEAFR